MTWESTWSIASDDGNSRQSFLSECDSEFDLSPPPRYPAEKHSTLALNKLSLDRDEPPLTRSRAKAIGKTTIMPQSVPKDQRRSTIRRSVDSFAGMATTFTNSILFPKQDLSDNRLPNSPTDGVKSLTDWFESCSLDESKFSKNCFWPSRETNSHYTRPVMSSSASMTFGSNPFPPPQTSPFFVQSSSTTATLFGQQQAQLWSRFRFAASSIRENLWMEQLNSPPSNLFTTANSQSFDQSPMLSPSSFDNFLPSLSSSPIAPSLLMKPLSFVNKESSSSLLKQRPSVESELLTKKEDVNIRKSSSKIFFTLIIFVVGLVLGYLLTNTFTPELIHQWFLLTWHFGFEISIKYFHLSLVYLQTVLKYFSSITLA